MAVKIEVEADRKMEISDSKAQRLIELTISYLENNADLEDELGLEFGSLLEAYRTAGVVNV